MKNLTKRDQEILFLTANFGGKIFVDVLEKTLWHGYSNAYVQARNRMQKLSNKYHLFIKKPTGLIKPRNAYVLSERGKDIVRTLFEINITNVSLSNVTVEHTMMEMITFYYLKMLDKKPLRTIVKNWSVKHYHTPDLVYEHEKGLIYVEIEKTVKSGGAYNSIFVNMIKDDVYKVLYVVENEKRVQQFARNLPTSEKIMLVSIDTLIENAQNGKIGAVSQKNILKSQGEKNDN